VRTCSLCCLHEVFSFLLLRPYTLTLSLPFLPSFFESSFDNQPKVFAVDRPDDLPQLLRWATNLRAPGLNWREARPYMLVEGLAFVPSATNPAAGTLQVRFVRSLVLIVIFCF
jgi:hypothetical protein